MEEVICRGCGGSSSLSREPSFCAFCGAPLPLTPAEFAEARPALEAVHAAILATVSDGTSVQIARTEGESAWTRIDPAGYSIVAWFRTISENSGVHGIETSPLRRGGFSITSSADKLKGRRVTIASIDELTAVLPQMLAD